MKILSMSATFGKLEGRTLPLQPGLNVIHAPNEWGKSTWCAFLVAMLYGIDTRERTTQTTLADKEHYAPWSGKPMSGRIELEWKGRNITIERSSKGRSVFGVFRAYETESGLPVPELTGDNCGLTLLGVEKSVFAKSAFIRLTDMPVTQDEALRRRLNALVTTGDESGTGDKLKQKLKDLKNHCRHNKTGLLPQAEAQRDTLKDKLELLYSLQARQQRIEARQAELEVQRKALENHRQALAFEASREDAARLEQAQNARQTAAGVLEQCSARCATLPDKALAVTQLQQLQQLRPQQQALDAESIPPEAVAPTAPEIFSGLSASEAIQKAKSDKAAYDMLCRPLSPALRIAAAGCALAGIGLLFVQWYLLLPMLALSTLFILLHLRSKSRQARDRQAICRHYGDLPAAQWIPLAQKYLDEAAAYQQAQAARKAVADSLTQRRQRLQQEELALTQGLSIEDAIAKWEHVLSQHEALQQAQDAYRHCDARARELADMIKSVAPPPEPDELTLSPAQTGNALADIAVEYHQLQLQAGQCMGQIQTLGQEDVLTRQLEAVEDRIRQLEDTYNALLIAMETLESATNELQRRFAPRIAQRAQELFGRMTGGRYDRLQLTQDLNLNAGAQGEESMQSALWRSDGTVDQLYLALRLAVAEELTPDAPLILDDALVRFDDTRLSNAMAILSEAALGKQVLLFTCQHREEQFL